MKIKYILLLLFVISVSIALSQQEKKYVLIIGSFSNVNNAKIFYNNAAIKGFEPMILKMETPKGVMYRVSAMQPSNYQQAKFIKLQVNEKLKIASAWPLQVTDNQIAESVVDISNVRNEAIKNEEIKKLEEARRDSIAKYNKMVIELAKQDSIRNEAIKKEEMQKLEIAKQDSIRNEEMQKLETAKQDSIRKAEMQKFEEARRDSIAQYNALVIEQAKQDSIRNEAIKNEEMQQLEIAKQDSIRKATENIAKNIDTTTTKIISDIAVNDSIETKTKEEKIDWEDFKSQFRVFLKAMISQNYTVANNYTDENGYFALRTFEGSRVADHYVDMKTLADLINYYGKSFDINDFIYNLKYYDIKIIPYEPLPEYICSRNVFNKNGLYFYEYKLNENQLDEVIINSSRYIAEETVSQVINSTNSGIRRSENIQLKGMYFSYKQGKLILRAIDFSNFCD